MKAVKACNISHAQKHHNTEHRATLGYIHSELSGQNERWDREFKANGNPKSLTNYLTQVKKNVKEKTKRTIQESSLDKAIQEAVVVIDDKVTMDDLKTFGKAMEQEFGFTCIQIHIHRDEGYMKKKKGGKEGKLNLHAHLFFETINRDTGKSWKRKADAGSRMQDLASETLGMVRGTPKAQSKIEGLDAVEFKEEQARKNLQEQEEILITVGKEVEEAKQELKETKSATEIKLEAAKEAAQGVWVATMAEISGTRKKADKAREALRELAERSKDIEEGKYIIQQIEAVKTQNRPQIEGLMKKHTKKNLFGGTKTDLKGVLEEYEHEVSIERRNTAYYANEKETELNREIRRLRREVEAKDEELITLKKNVSAIVEILGNKFKGLYNDVKDYFKGQKDNLSMAVSLWFGSVWNNRKEKGDPSREEYKADRNQGRMLVNNMSVEEWRRELEERRRKEERIRHEQKQSRGRGMRF